MVIVTSVESAPGGMSSLLPLDDEVVPSPVPTTADESPPDPSDVPC